MCLINAFGPLKTSRPKVVYKSGWKLLDDRFGSFAVSGYAYKLQEVQPFVLIKPYEDSCIEQGYHSFQKLGNMLNSGCGDLEGVFIIPANIVYYTGRNPDWTQGIVSSQLIYMGSVRSPLSWLRVTSYFIKHYYNTWKQSIKKSKGI